MAPAPDQVRREPRQQVLHGLAATGQEPVGVPDLGDAATRHRAVREVVAVEDDDLLVRLAQRLRGQQPGDARADHERAVDGSGHEDLQVGSGYAGGYGSGATIAPARPRTFDTATVEKDGLPAVRSATRAVPA